jgi:adenosylcobinamide hydrolase
MEIAWHARSEDARTLPFVTWSFREPRLAVSSATLGGGLGPRSWVLNATVPHGYDRDDPAEHLAELAALAGCAGDGIGLLTAVDVTSTRHASDGGVDVWATVGIDRPEWAAAPSPTWHDMTAARVLPTVGTINIVVDVPVRLSEGALVNAVATVVEAKAQAMIGLGFAGTGTPTDAVCVVCPTAGAAEPYGGPRSVWGARIARAVHAAIIARPDQRDTWSAP